MRVPLSWLRDYVDIDLSPRALADELTMRGMEVSAIEVAGASWTGVVVGRLLDVRRHPNADTLWLTTVDAGDGPVEIVCGAQNLEVGQLVPAALVGAMLPGDRRIERTKIRGEISNGMLCSAAELGLGTDADGIHILGRGDELTPGTPLAEVVGETVLDVDVKPNRGDALSMVGLAREVAAFTGAELRLPSAEVAESDEPTDAHVASGSRSRSSTRGSPRAGSTAWSTAHPRTGCSAAWLPRACGRSARWWTSPTTSCMSSGSRSTPMTPIGSPRAGSWSAVGGAGSGSRRSTT